MTTTVAAAPTKDERLANAIDYAEGVLDRSALSIGVKTTADDERDFRSCIRMAMNAIRHELPVELTDGQVVLCGEKGLLSVALPAPASALSIQAYAEKVAAIAVREALALRSGKTSEQAQATQGPMRAEPDRGTQYWRLMPTGGWLYTWTGEPDDFAYMRNGLAFASREALQLAQYGEVRPARSLSSKRKR